MDDIAEAAGVTKPLVYQHFSSKRALYLELVDSIAQELLLAVRSAVLAADGPRQQVEMGFAAYFRLVVSREDEFRLLYGRDHADDKELGRALRTVEDAIAEAIEPLIDAGLDDDTPAPSGLCRGGHGRRGEPGVHGAADDGPRTGRRRSTSAGPPSGQPGLGRVALGPRRLTAPPATAPPGTPPLDTVVPMPVEKSASPSQLIDGRIEELGDWRGTMLSRLRALVKEADPEVVEEWKWRGVPVWEHDGIICTGETYKSIVKLTFAKGASLPDPSGLFNSSLEGNTRRAIDFHEGEKINEKAFKTLIRAAVTLNLSKAKAKK